MFLYRQWILPGSPPSLTVNTMFGDTVQLYVFILIMVSNLPENSLLKHI